MRVLDGAAWAWLGGRLATDLVEVADDPAALDRPGFWAVVATFEGAVTCARFATVRPSARPPRTVGAWVGPAAAEWVSSMGQEAYEEAVAHVRSLVAAGDVYQVNVCRVLAAPLPRADDPAGTDLAALQTRLVRGNPAPYPAVVDLPDHGVRVVSASPELFLRRDGDLLESGPIKGTGRVREDLRTKDVAENVMITDLVRNDLGRVAVTGSVVVTSLCRVEHHPGLVHLVSRVRATLRPGTGWGEVFAATFPPGSVSGAPKASALSVIATVEPVARGPYCGAVGWVQDRRTAALAVGIRTFWLAGGQVHFGTGAGIVWGSDPSGEWAETVLKASRLVPLASG